MVIFAMKRASRSLACSRNLHNPARLGNRLAWLVKQFEGTQSSTMLNEFSSKA